MPDAVAAHLRVQAEAAMKRAAAAPDKALREQWAMIASHYLDLADLFEVVKAEPGAAG